MALSSYDFNRALRECQLFSRVKTKWTLLCGSWWRWCDDGCGGGVSVSDGWSDDAILLCLSVCHVCINLIEKCFAKCRPRFNGMHVNGNRIQ